MTDKQPKALRLADDLQSAVQTYPQMSEDEPGGYFRQEDALMDDAAAELRRLLAANIDCVAWYEAVKAQRDELLKALEFFLKWGRCQKAEDMARSAIAKTESSS